MCNRWMQLLISCSIITFSGQTQPERAVQVPSSGACKRVPESNEQLDDMDSHTGSFTTWIQ